jgi:hypothetical protein
MGHHIGRPERQQVKRRTQAPAREEVDDKNRDVGDEQGPDAWRKPARRKKAARVGPCTDCHAGSNGQHNIQLKLPQSDEVDAKIKQAGIGMIFGRSLFFMDLIKRKGVINASGARWRW